MVEIADVKDRESLTAYLENLEGNAGQLTARHVAFSGSARILPLALDYFLREDLAEGHSTASSIFGAISIVGVRTEYPALSLDSKAAHAATAAFTTFRAASSVAFGNPASFAASFSALATFAAVGAAGDVDSAAKTAATAVAAAASAAQAAGAESAIWNSVHFDLQSQAESSRSGPAGLWQGTEEPSKIGHAWESAKQQLQNDAGADWSFWILWYERVRAGRDFHADKLADILNSLREEDWKKGPAHINPLFDDLLALYREEDAALASSDADSLGQRSARQITAVRAQVAALKEYVETEFEFLRGQNQFELGTEAEIEALVEILRQLRALVDEMLRAVDQESDAGTALVAIENSLPAVVDKADALAEIEKEPQVSEVVLGMAASIKVLTESGTPGSLATGIAALDMVRQTAKGWLTRDRSTE